MNAPAPKPGPRRSHLESGEAQALVREIDELRDLLTKSIDAVQRGLSYANTSIRDLEGTIKVIAQSDASLTNQLTQVRGHIAAHDNRLDAHQNVHLNLHTRVEVIESGAKKPGQKIDQLTTDVLDFMKRIPGMRVNGGTVTTNLACNSSEYADLELKIVNNAVRVRLDTLAKQGLIKTQKDAGRVTVFWYEEKENESE